MFSWVQLALTLFKAISWIMDYVERQGLISEGEDREIAREAAKLLQRTQHAKQILSEVSSMSEPAVDEWLRRLEPEERTDNK